MLQQQMGEKRWEKAVGGSGTPKTAAVVGWRRAQDLYYDKYDRAYLRGRTHALGCSSSQPGLYSGLVLVLAVELVSDRPLPLLQLRRTRHGCGSEMQCRSTPTCVPSADFLDGGSSNCPGDE